MFRSAYHSGHLSILYAVGSRPLGIWEIKEGDGAVTRVTDADLASSAIELRSKNVTTTTATCPAPSAFPTPAAAAAGLGVRLPVLVLLVKAFPGEPFTLEVALRDDAGRARRLRASTFQSVPRVAPAVAALPLRLPEGWAALAFDLHDFCRRAYGTGFAEATRVTIHANCRLRRVYFAARAAPEAELPPEFRLYLPRAAGGRAGAGAGGAGVAAAPAGPAEAALEEGAAAAPAEGEEGAEGGEEVVVEAAEVEME